MMNWTELDQPPPPVDPAVPAWQRPTAGEQRWPVAVALLVAIGLQLLLPTRLGLEPKWLLPGLESVLLLGLMIANPLRINRPARTQRITSLALCGLISLANGASCALLLAALVRGDTDLDAKALLGSGAAIWLTNVIVFGLWYWELDRGGPSSRAAGLRVNPDFAFPQMSNPRLARADWEPNFFDYLYTAFTNATAFSPTDTMPLTRWAKGAMAVQEMSLS